jgi:predicted dehydrogenase
MNLAFVGSPAEWRDFQSTAGETRRHLLTAVLSDPAIAASSEWPPSARVATDLEELLLDRSVDCLVLAGPISSRLERLRQAIAAARPCLCMMPLDLDAIAYHEAAMAADDQRVVIVPHLPGRLHPAWREFVGHCRSASYGAMRLATLERTGPAPVSGRLIAETYAEAVDLVADLIGEVVEVTAAGDLDAGRLTVHHRTAAGLVGEIRLLSEPSVRDASPKPVRWRFSAEMEHGRATLSFDAGLAGAARICVEGLASAQTVSGPDGDHDTLSEFSRAVAGEPHTPTWADAARAAELADSVRISLERRRAVDVYYEHHGELASFKGRMTSLGCGLIWLTLFLLLIVAAGKGLNLPATDWIAAAAAAVWLFFLALQTLRWVLPREIKHSSAAPGRQNGDRA